MAEVPARPVVRLELHRLGRKVGEAVVDDFFRIVLAEDDGRLGGMPERLRDTPIRSILPVRDVEG